jgi:predicted transcriptional regulator
VVVLADARVAELVVTCPTVHDADATVGELRAFFLDAHKHLALLVDGGRLVTTVTRSDLSPGLGNDVPARLVGTVRGRSVSSGASAQRTLAAMRETKRRRLVVTDDDGALLGLLCLKARAHGFCSDADVASRQLAVA